MNEPPAQGEEQVETANIFEYDVFLSFASSDEGLVKPVWQELCLSGLRVFWSDAALKNELGNSWIEVIESALDRSRHMLLVCSPDSLSSTWVKREYRAFLEHCYKPGVRRLIPILIQGYSAKDLPLFLRELEAKRLGEPNSLKEVISILGGVNIEELRDENRLLKQNLESLRRDKLTLERELNEFKNGLRKPVGNDEARAQGRPAATEPEGRHAEDAPPVTAEHTEAEKIKAFEFLRLPPDASSREILQKYETLKIDYEALLNNCPRGLREVCENRLNGLNTAFALVFTERREEERQRVRSAYELLQLPEGAARLTIIKKYRELRTACVRALQSPDQFIKDAATEELEKLEAAYQTLVPEESWVAAGLKEERLSVEVIMPQMGEQIAEGTITRWLKKEGEPVERDEPLFEISTDKVDAEIPAPAGGTVGKILFGEGTTVAVNTTVAYILE